MFETTVRDKINRQIEINHAEFVELIIAFHQSQGEDKRMEQHLCKYAGNNTYDEDQKLIKDSFERFRNTYKSKAESR